MPPVTAAVAWQTATIERIEILTPRVKGFTLRPATWRPFVAGQHLDIRLTAPDGYAAQRSYSVCSAPEREGGYEVAIELLEDGEVSPFFHEIAAVGDEIEIRGPFGGHFAWDGGDGGPLLLIGGGSGVAPLVSILRHRAGRAPQVPALLVCGARSWGELIFRDELLARDADEPGFRLLLALSRDRARRPQDIARRIDSVLLRAGLEGLGGPPRLSFICGANRFVEAAAQILLDLGPPAGSIRTERYGGA